MTIAVAKKKARLGRQALIEEHCFFLFISPWVLGFLIFTIGPMVASVYYSLCIYDVLTPPRFVGLANYAQLTRDELFWQGLKVTAIYSLSSVALGILASMCIALLLNRNVKGVAFYRTLYYLPSVISGVAVGLLWMWIFNPNFGILNYLLWALFRIKGPLWIYGERTALASLILMSLWGIGGGIVIYLARLQSIPTELYEAAEIDGAGSLRRILAITLPLMTPVVFFNLLMGLIGAFQSFTQVYVMTSGGPHYATWMYVFYLYNAAFKEYRMGFASALAWVLFVILLLLTLLVFRTSSRWVHYEAG